MKKYLIIIFILALLFISGCQVPKTGEATAKKSPTATPTTCVSSATVTRSVASNSVNLDISTSCLNNDETIAIVDRIPSGTTFVQGSFIPTPTYILEDKVIWLFAKNPTQTLFKDGRKITERIPTRLSYKFSGTCGSEFKGKWSLYLADKDGLIGGKSTC